MTHLENTQGPQEKLPHALSAIIEGMQLRLGKSTDIIYRFITLGPSSIVIIFIEGLADPQEMIQAIHEDSSLYQQFSQPQPESCLKLLQERTLSSARSGRSATTRSWSVSYSPVTRSSSLTELRRRYLPVRRH